MLALVPFAVEFRVQLSNMVSRNVGHLEDLSSLISEFLFGMSLVNNDMRFFVALPARLLELRTRHC